MTQETKFEKALRTVVHVGVAVIATVFTLFFFFIPQPCDLDKQYLWCRVHPMKIWDILGLILFYIGAAWLSGLLPLLLIKKNKIEDDQEEGKKGTFIAAAALVLGFILIYAA